MDDLYHLMLRPKREGTVQGTSTHPVTDSPLPYAKERRQEGHTASWQSLEALLR